MKLSARSRMSANDVYGSGRNNVTPSWDQVSTIIETHGVSTELTMASQCRHDHGAALIEWTLLHICRCSNSEFKARAVVC